MTYQSLNYYRKSHLRSGAKGNPERRERLHIHGGGEPPENQPEPEPGSGFLPGQRMAGAWRELQQIPTEGPEGVRGWPGERENVSAQ